MACQAHQASDQMTCVCGNTWDMNDPNPPECGAMAEQPIRRTPEEWDAFFYAMAETIATLSKDPDRKVGALLVTPDRRQFSFGYNGLPPSIPDFPSLLADQERKQGLMVHAEDNCLQQSPFPAANCTLYVTRFPCHVCADKLLEKGVRRVVAPGPDFGHPRWGLSWKAAYARLQGVGIKVTIV